MVGDGINDLGIHYHSIERNQVRVVFADFHLFVEDLIARLLEVGNAAQSELDHQRVLVRLFVQAVTQFVQHLDGTTDNHEDFVLQQQLFIRVHWR